MEQLSRCRCTNAVSRSPAGTPQALRIKQAQVWEAIPDPVDLPGLGQGVSRVAEVSPCRSLQLLGESIGLSPLQHSTLKLCLNKSPNSASIVYSSNIQPAALEVAGAHPGHGRILPCQPWTHQPRCSASPNKLPSSSSCCKSPASKCQGFLMTSTSATDRSV